MNQLESKKYIFTEWRLPITGKSIDEWNNLATWVTQNDL